MVTGRQQRSIHVFQKHRDYEMSELIELYCIRIKSNIPFNLSKDLYTNQCGIKNILISKPPSANICKKAPRHKRDSAKRYLRG